MEQANGDVTAKPLECLWWRRRSRDDPSGRTRRSFAPFRCTESSRTVHTYNCVPGSSLTRYNLRRSCPLNCHARSMDLQQAADALNTFAHDLKPIVDRDPEQEVQGLALPIIDAVLAAARAHIPSGDPVLDLATELRTPQVEHAERLDAAIGPRLWRRGVAGVAAESAGVGRRAASINWAGVMVLVRTRASASRPQRGTPRRTRRPRRWLGTCGGSSLPNLLR